MFVCPHCKYRLPACWKAHAHFLYAFYCRLDEFESFYAARVVDMLKKKTDVHNVSCINPLEPGDWTFHLTKSKGENSRYVIMILTEFKEFIYKRNLIERHVAAKNEGQSRLELEASAQ